MATVLTEERASELVGIEEMQRRAEEREARESTAAIETMCRVTLHPDYKKGLPDHERILVLKWHRGQGHRTTEKKVLRPGETMTITKERTFGWFGPFHVLGEFQNETDSRARERLAEFWKQEKERVLAMWGYPMTPFGGSRMNLTPIGPHRFPRVVIVMIDSNGRESPPIDTHRIYEIGEFDRNYPLDSFGPQETVDEVRAQANAEIERVSKQADKDVTELRREMAEVVGIVKGMSIAVAQPSVKPEAAAAGG